MGELRSGLTAADLPVPGTERDLGEVLRARVSFTIEDDTIERPELVRLLGRLGRALESSLSDSEFLGALPILCDAPTLVDVLGKLRRAVVTRIGFANFISEARYGPELQEWLVMASSVDLLRLEQALLLEDFEGLIRLMDVT